MSAPKKTIWGFQAPQTGIWNIQDDLSTSIFGFYELFASRGTDPAEGYGIKYEGSLFVRKVRVVVFRIVVIFLSSPLWA